MEKFIERTTEGITALIMAGLFAFFPWHIVLAFAGGSAWTIVGVDHAITLARLP